MGVVLSCCACSELLHINKKLTHPGGGDVKRDLEEVEEVRHW